MSIQSIIETKIFKETDNIEIVISDNASNDETSIIVKKYLCEYPNKIKYNRNQDNLKARNVEIALSLGTGVFRKLANDNILYSEETLSFLIRLVKENSQTRPLLFFPNGSIKMKSSQIEIETVEEFLLTVSYFATWIGAFGMWEEQLEFLYIFSDYYKTEIPQVKLIYEFLKHNPKSLIVNDVLFIMNPIKFKSNYDLFKIFGYNYINILKEFSSNISNRYIENEKKRVLFGFILPNYLDLGKRMIPCNNSFKCLFKTYKYNWYFYILPFVAFSYYVAFKLKKYIPQKFRSIMRNVLVK